MRKAIISIIFVFILANMPAQETLSGMFPFLKNQKISLVGFSGFGTYTIDSVSVDENGNFFLSFDKSDYGMGLLMSDDKNPFAVILAENEGLRIEGETFGFTGIKIVNGRQNQCFARYAAEHPRREQAISAWEYLEKIYGEDSIFTKNETAIQAISAEKKRIKAEDSLFLASLPSETYVSWYLPLRKLVTSVSTIAQYRTDEIPVAIASFRNIDYADPRLQKSGLLADVVESHFWLLENSGLPLDSVYREMSVSIDCMIDNLLQDEQQLNEIAEHLFKLLEKRSLFKASEYLALKLLTEQGCTLGNDFASQLESYRAMKRGNIAPDFKFEGTVVASGYEKTPRLLSELKSKYTVVVFGASWCPQCPQELLNMSRLYDKWKAHGVEVIFVSLDEDEKVFRNFTEVFPFISVCDYKKWESPMVKKYCVFATPTIYLLDNKREILLRPNSASQLDAWVEMYLK